MGEWLIDLGNWLAAMLPANLAPAQATIRSAQMTSAAALAGAFLALVAAIIAGMIALRNGYLGARTAAQIKHAEFRQTWINSLRDEMSTFQSLAVGTGLGDTDKEQRLAASATKILLLMNPKDPDYRELLNSLHAVMGGWKVSRRDFLVQHAETNALFQRILKREWTVTKGEMHAIAHFFWMRFLIQVCLGFIWLAKLLYRHVIRPIALWLEPRVWGWTKWGIVKLIDAHRAHLARQRKVVVPDNIDLNEMDDQKEGLAGLVHTDAISSSSRGSKRSGFRARFRAAAAHLFDGQPLT
jgi:hypothetical protein